MGRSNTPPLDPEVRFMAKVSIAPNGCWEWTAGKNRAGYTRFADVSGTTVQAHRWSYEHFVGPIPAGLQIDHLCRNVGCVNPAHLEAVTGLVNTRRGTYANKTHCKWGHEFTPVNTYSPKTAPWRRACRTCIRNRSKSQ